MPTEDINTALNNLLLFFNHALDTEIDSTSLLATLTHNIHYIAQFSCLQAFEKMLPVSPEENMWRHDAIAHFNYSTLPLSAKQVSVFLNTLAIYNCTENIAIRPATLEQWIYLSYADKTEKNRILTMHEQYHDFLQEKHDANRQNIPA